LPHLEEALGSHFRELPELIARLQDLSENYRDTGYEAAEVRHSFPF